MTVVATGLVVFASVLTFGLTDGLEHALRISGEPLDLIVMRQGTNEETSSGLDQQTANQLLTLPGIARSSNGEPLCSIEYATILTKPRRNDGGTTNVIVRGLDPVGRELRPGFRITQGRDLQPGVNEIVTSERMARRFENLALGEKLEINRVDFTVVGYFEAAGSSAESEVWCDRRDLTSARRIPNGVTSVNLRARDAEAMASLVRQIQDDEQFKLNAVTETAYYENQLGTANIVKYVGRVIAAFLTFGAMFAAANTMYAAVSNRAREIGTLRALGFPRTSILTSFLLESVLLCLLGGVLGCLATLPFHGLSTGTANWATFSEITFAFRFGPWVLLRGVLLALTMGLLGGLFPALRAVSLTTVDALRQA
jgi:putative ABC transport system permease protein